MSGFETASGDNHDEPLLALVLRSPRFGRRLAATACLGLAVLVLVGSNRRPVDPHRGHLPIDTARLRAPSIRLGTFNIHRGRGDSGQVDLALTAKTLRDLDLAVLQEVGSVVGGDDQVTELGRMLGMAARFLPVERRWYRDNFGNGLLSRVAVEEILAIPLPGTQPARFRQIFLLRVPVGETALTVVSAHLDNQADHELQLITTIALFRALAPPVVLLGDLNTMGSHPELSRLTQEDGVTVANDRDRPFDVNAIGVDWIIGRGLSIDSVQSVDLGASDHPHLRAVITPHVAATLQ